MAKAVKIADRWVGEGYPTYVVAEIGINHNGDLELAKRMIQAAKDSGVDAVKFQKRTPELCVPEEQKGQMRETPWGYITYLDYRYKVEFGEAEYREIERFCKEIGITWFTSVWDERSVDFMEAFEPVCYKIPSAMLTDHSLLRHLRATGRPLILSTGMSTMEEIREAVEVVGTDKLVITHATSTYPCDPTELNLLMIRTLKKEFPVPVGYSGHEVGLIPSVVAASLGACMVERHITLDRAMWGSDQAASVEPGGFERMVKYIRVAEQSLGDGVKRVYESEMSSRKKLRRN
ncbi:N-acetylneuraminate synthase family protein [Levilinea saccharolytica]|uniref:N-acetylneuraminate synthase n=1 Tax=Levilinea saccharolytica TaxID=229921 RepID=A0A0P6XM20_9CHLR|nr:N-acetylneuraminate synthase family protein [Levilinea saccharolytica]KPL77382.1 N-acetylneuraminate synthase [Levilinea saccharolytica]GAP18720.1 N-acetylneuraminate synthase [Levilinea saccharolytica]